MEKHIVLKIIIALSTLVVAMAIAVSTAQAFLSLS
jgi:hypothetical protein